ncbi:MAG: BON domain-containing protein [Nitriliruptorales bacterium]|nr:BON domain-containing protein [Nitriliruptorales bacterium]
MRLPWKTFLVGGAVTAGAAVQYFLDTEQGRTRRVRTRDQVASRVRTAGRKLEDEMAVQRKRTQDRLVGMAHEATCDAAAETPDNDRTLVDKVRSEVLGGPEWSPYTINVDAVDGVVALRGQLDRPGQIRELRRRVEQVAGVRSVDSFLHLPGTTAPNAPAAEETSPSEH